MFGMSHDAYLLLDALVTIIGLIVLITRFKVHPFIALIIAAGFLGLTSGMPVEKIVKSFQDGFGGVLGFVGVILALGTMLGKLMADSGGADQIARTLIRAFGKERVHWSMMLAAFLVGIPLFFEIGFILLIPLVFIVARRSGVSLIKIGIPLLAGLSAVHGLVPPHPGPLLAIGVFGADIGKTILYGLIVALPTAAIAGPLFGALVSRYIPGTPSAELVEQIAHEPETQDLPSFGVTLATVLLPVFLMLLKTFADVAFPDGHAFRAWMDMIGHPISALLLALLVALYTFGYARGFDSKKILRLPDQSLGTDRRHRDDHRRRRRLQADAGGQRGRRRHRHLAVNAQISPILLAWLVAAVIRIATGSATVATITGAGIVVPVIDLIPGVNRELLVLATGAGSLILSHVNDAGFWLVKQYFNMSVSETFKTWTAMETILSVVGLVFILLLSLVL